jgi:Ca2+/H+ antiporter
MILRLLCIFISAFGATFAHADVSLGDVANAMMVPTNMMSTTLIDIAYILGVALFLSGLAQYREHRNNPGGVPFLRPLILLILGVIVFCIPWIAKLSPAAYL